MRLLLSVSTVFVLFFFISCQKEFSVENGSGSPTGGSGTTTGDSIYLDKVIEVWDGSDTTLTQFNYDNLKRVVSLKEKNSWSIIVAADSTVTTFFYTSTDTLPYKYIAHEDTKWLSPAVYEVFLDTTFLTWDIQKRLILDSSISNYTSSGGSFQRSKIIESIQYSPGTIIYKRNTTPITVFPPSGGFELPSNDTAWLDANNNIIKDVSYDVYGTNPLDQNLAYSGTYTFDNKPSPYLTLNIFKLLNTNHGHKSWFTPQVNNYLTFHSEESSYNTFSYTIQNFYNAKGQLVKAISYDAINNSSNERYFYYKSL